MKESEIGWRKHLSELESQVAKGHADQSGQRMAIFPSRKLLTGKSFVTDLCSTSRILRRLPHMLYNIVLTWMLMTFTSETGFSLVKSSLKMQPTPLGTSHSNVMLACCGFAGQKFPVNIFKNHLRLYLACGVNAVVGHWNDCSNCKI